MKILYIECRMGAAGDMLMSALSELVSDQNDFVRRFNEIGIPNVQLELKKDNKCGINGTHISVKVSGEEENEYMHEHHEHHHHHNSLADIEKLISSLPIKSKVCKDALAVYRLIAEAESSVHGCEIDNIHFHEVGTMDAVADVVGVCMLVDEIGADKIVASPVNTGGGFVKCAHGVLPVPAPATAYLLKGIPSYSDSDEGEMCTPTGAALLRYFVSEFKKRPEMCVENIGCGLGTKNFSKANILRVFLGGTESEKEYVYELSCNIDDMTGEDMAFASEQIMKAGAKDVFTVPIGMKKGRPAVLLNCICTPDNKETIVSSIFKHTTTLGIREKKCSRYVLERKIETASTKYGEVRLKTAFGYGIKRKKAEYDDIAALAVKHSVPISEIRKSISDQ